MASQPRVFVIVPTYNEAKNISSLVGDILGVAASTQVIIVDDNSPDGTGKIADELSATHPRVRVIHRAGKLGLGTAYLAGFRKALAEDADRIITMDADFSHDPAYIPGLLALTDRLDIAVGSRYVPGGGTRNWTWKRRLISWGANTFARFMLGLKTHDCTAGFRCYRREVLESIDLDQFFSNGYSFLIEMLFKCQQQGYVTGELPIIFANRTHGSSKISRQEIYKAMYTVLRLAGGRIVPRSAAVPVLKSKKSRSADN